MDQLLARNTAVFLSTCPRPRGGRGGGGGAPLGAHARNVFDRTGGRRQVHGGGGGGVRADMEKWPTVIGLSSFVCPSVDVATVLSLFLFFCFADRDCVERRRSPGFHDELEIPVIDNTTNEENLADSLAEAITK